MDKQSLQLLLFDFILATDGNKTNNPHHWRTLSRHRPSLSGTKPDPRLQDFLHRGDRIPEVEVEVEVEVE